MSDHGGLWAWWAPPRRHPVGRQLLLRPEEERGPYGQLVLPPVLTCTLNTLTWVAMWRLLLLALTCAGQSSDYCGISRQHTMCRNKGLGPLCGTPGERGLGTVDQREVTDYHNRLDKMFQARMTTFWIRLRSRVAQGLTGQPPAANMRQLQWDPELARLVTLVPVVMMVLMPTGYNSRIFSKP